MCLGRMSSELERGGLLREGMAGKGGGCKSGGNGAFGRGLGLPKQCFKNKG